MQLQQKKEEFTITLSNAINAFDKQKLIDFAMYLELTSKVKSKQKDADDLAEQANTAWWKKNKKRFIK